MFLIGMKLALDVWQSLLGVYTTFQIDIKKYLEKAWEKFKTHKNNRQFQIYVFCNEGKYTAGHLWFKFEEFTLI